MKKLIILLLLMLVTTTGFAMEGYVYEGGVTPKLGGATEPWGWSKNGYGTDVKYIVVATITEFHSMASPDASIIWEEKKEKVHLFDTYNEAEMHVRVNQQFVFPKVRVDYVIYEGMRLSQ